MTRIGVTGHVNLAPGTASLIEPEIRRILGAHDPQELVGFSCMAAGADTIFAEAVLHAGGRLEVVLPAADYRARKVKADHAQRFDSVLRRAAKVHIMPHAEANPAAYETANLFVLQSIDLLVAVWDGKSAFDQGGTAAAVGQARGLGTPIEIVWPPAAARA